MTLESNGHLDRLDAYLDDLLSAEELSVFERELETNAALRSALATQQRIDDRLRRGCVVPSPERFGDLARAARDVALTPPPAAVTAPRRRRRLVALAAAIALLVTGAWLMIRVVTPGTTGPRYAVEAQRTLETVYTDEVATGYTPEIVCRDDAEFQSWFHDQFGQALTLRELPPGTRALGLSYSHSLSPWTIHLLGEADDTPVVVFIDLAGGIGPLPETADHDETIQRHCRVIGALVLYELSPFDTPRLLDAFDDPGEEKAP